MAVIIVKTRRLERFRRAGLEFSRVGVELDTDALSEDQLAAIEGEPNLVVEVLEAAPAEPKAKATKASSKAGA